MLLLRKSFQKQKRGGEAPKLAPRPSPQLVLLGVDGVRAGIPRQHSEARGGRRLRVLWRRVPQESTGARHRQRQRAGLGRPHPPSAGRAQIPRVQLQQEVLPGRPLPPASQTQPRWNQWQVDQHARERLHDRGGTAAPYSMSLVCAPRGGAPMLSKTRRQNPSQDARIVSLRFPGRFANRTGMDREGILQQTQRRGTVGQETGTTTVRLNPTPRGVCSRSGTPRPRLGRRRGIWPSRGCNAELAGTLLFPNEGSRSQLVPDKETRFSAPRAGFLQDPHHTEPPGGWYLLQDHTGHSDDGCQRAWFLNDTGRDGRVGGDGVLMGLLRRSRRGILGPAGAWRAAAVPGVEGLWDSEN